MGLSVSKEAAEWYIDEMSLKEGDYVRFIVKLYGGIPTAHPSYFLGVSYGKEGDIAIKDVVEGITFYFITQDAWLLDDYNLDVIMGEEEAEFGFVEKDE